MSGMVGVRPRPWRALLLLLIAVPLLLALVWPVAGEAPSARTHVVEIRGFEYHPQALEVARGDTVVWINHDAVPHTATAVEGEWDSGSIAPEARWQRVFTAEGRTPYTCTFHPGMRGTLVVQ